MASRRSCRPESTPGDARLTDTATDGEAEALVRALPVTEMRYEIEGPIGHEGAFFKARDRTLCRPVAISRLAVCHGASPAKVVRFLRTAQAIAALHHPGIVPIYEVARDALGPFIAMEWVEGRNLADLVAERGPMPVTLACSVAAEIADALEHAHRHGVVHHNVKSHNIVVPESGSARVTGFGLAHEGAPETGDDAGGTSGIFMAPEQLLAGGRTDARTDIFGLGKTLYHALSGELPRAVVFDLVAPEVRDVLRRALRVQPADRYQTMAEFRDALRDVAGRSRPISGAGLGGLCTRCGAKNDPEATVCEKCRREMLASHEVQELRRKRSWGLVKSADQEEAEPAPAIDEAALAREQAATERAKEEEAHRAAEEAARQAAGERRRAAGEAETERRRVERVAEHWRALEAARAGHRWRKMIATAQALKQLTPEDARVGPLLAEAERRLAKIARHLDGAEDALRRGKPQTAIALAEAVLVESAADPRAERVIARATEVAARIGPIRTQADEAFAAGFLRRAANLYAKVIAEFPDDEDAAANRAAALATLETGRVRRWQVVAVLAMATLVGVTILVVLLLAGV